MTMTKTSHNGIQVDQRRMVGGAVLVGIGGLLGFMGILLVSSALATAVRRWIQQLEQPPSEIAKLRWQQAKAATTAGAEAWRSGLPASHPS
jgi:hypothetical protein